MSETKNLKLFKHEEPLETNNNKFDIDKALNKNWDKVDDYAGEANSKIDLITEIIDLLPKVSNEGESIALENTARAKFTKFRIEGNSKQETRSGKNKLQITATNKTINGVTFTINEDKTITFKGTNSSYWIEFIISDSFTLQAGTYFIKSFIKMPNGCYLTLRNKTTNTVITSISSVTDISEFTLNEDTIVDVYIGLGNEASYNHTIFPMITINSSDEYEQYEASSSLEFPSEIRNVGDNGNLYDKDNPNVLDTPIDTSGLGGNVKNTYKTVWIPCKPNTTYTVSKKYDATKNRFTLAYTSEEPNYSQQVEGYVSNAYTNVMTITTNSTAKYLIAYVWIAGGSNTYQEMLDSIKIERGVQATADSGYGCGNIEINTVNKNLLDQSLELFQGNYDNNGNVITNSDRRIDKYIFLAKGNYILWSTINNWINVLIYDKNKKLLSIKNSNTNKEIAFTLDEDGYIRFGFNPTVKSLKVFQLERNTEKTTSEEHKQQIIIFPFKQGQKLMQGDYLADDGIHNTKTQIQLDGVTNGLKVSKVTKHSNNIYYCVINLVKQSINNTTDVSSMYCSHFMPHFEVKPGSCYIAGSGLYLVLVLTDQTITTVDAANTWLATQKEKGTPVVIEYKLAEEEIETYTEVQKEAYEQIKNAISYKGQTNIFSTNEIKPIFKVEALADIGLLLNNMQAQILAGGE